MRSRLWWLACCVVLLLAFRPREAVAQQDPMAPMGAHFAGHGPNLGGGSGYAASVPLDLPPARGGLPVPVSVVHTGTPMGAAGRGWELPLSFVREDRSFARRRPSGPLGGAPVMRPRVTLSLAGQMTELVPEGNDWVPRGIAGGLIARRDSGTNWKVYDGDGLTYVFNIQPASDLRLLSRIEGPGKSIMVFDYDFRFPTVHPQSSGSQPLPAYSGSAIDLVRVQYNFADAGPPKHEVLLEYGPEQSEPSSTNVLAGNNLVWLRMRTLERIVVRSRPQVTGGMQTLATYRLHYGADPDTRLPRLESVTLSGQEGTPEANQELPVARYEYGTATTPVTLSDGTPGAELRYQKLPQAVPFAAEASHDQIAGSKLGPGVGATRVVVAQQLMDVTGDGRADLVFRRNHPTHPLMVARQRPDAGGVPVLTDAALTGTFNDGVMKKDRLDAFSHEERLDPVDDFLDEKTDTITDTFSMFIDANGDGRPDLIDAEEMPNNQWVVYLNAPMDGFPDNTRWVRRVYNVSHLAALLTARGNVLRNGQVPLMRQYTGASIDVDTCWKYDRSDNVWRRVFDVPCQLAPPPQLRRRGEITATAWRLMDFNGDGGLDFLMEPVGPRTVLQETVPCHHGGPPQPGHPECSVPSDDLVDITARHYRVADSNTLEVMFNNGPITEIIPRSSAVTVGGCGLGRTGVDMLSPNSVPNPREECALEDVNGDGLADSISVISGTPVAHLGTGIAFSKAYLVLPGPTAYTTYVRPGSCSAAQNTTTTQGYRDLTGDGIPDFIGQVRLGTSPAGLPILGRGAAIGTGAGFAPGIRVSGSSGLLDLSRVSDKCDPTRSLTTAGLYEMDGDGRPEQVVLNAAGSLDIFQLVGRTGGQPVARALSAGLLTAFENGHGARTEISYQSAKDDRSTPHQVPYSEIVVREVRTVEQTTGRTSRTRYAYGRASLGYDPIEARFRFPGYERSVALSFSDASTTTEGGVAIITDAARDLIPLGATNPLPLNFKQVFENYLKPGRPEAMTVLAHAELNDPAALLTVNEHTDSRVIGQRFFLYDARLFGAGSSLPSDTACRYSGNPYEPTLLSSLDTCTSHGFLFETYRESRAGGKLPALANVMTSDSVLSVDDFGRVTKSLAANDMRRSDDDVCTETTYAAPPPNTLPRVLSAESMVVTGVCSESNAMTQVLSVEIHEYDQLPVFQVSAGFLTSRITERIDTQSGDVIQTTRDFEAKYDSLGNLSQLTMPDGARSQTVTLTYDPFGVVVVGQVREGRLLPNTVTTLPVTTVVDPVSLLPLGATDPNGTQTGATYDGFGRPVLSTLTLPGGTAGVIAQTRYLGFEGGSPQGRRVIVKTFDNPVPPAAVDATPGHASTTFLDEFGRTVKTLVDLGNDYAEDLVMGDISYDGSGRVAFAADPYPSTASPATAYGTTYFYNLDGTPRCSVRGNGRRPFTDVTNEALEIFPTCHSRRYEAGTEIVSTRTADSLQPGSAQASVERTATLSAIGRVMTRSTTGPTGRLEHSEFGYDRLGNTISVRRFASPNAVPPADPVAWSFRYDSLGQMTSMSEPNTATRAFTYTNWGELRSVDLTLANGTPERQVMAYDGLGRMTFRGEFVNGSAVPDTEYTYSYDQAVSIHPAQPAKNGLGRLTRAHSAGSDVFFGYDAFGSINGKATRDPQGAIYVETAAYDADGTLTEVAVLPPGTGNVPERVKYEYDSARRLHAAEHRDAADHGTRLYTLDHIDAFGRPRQAVIGNQDPVAYLASYAETGRRLPSRIAVESPTGDMRSIEYLGFDPLGRERQRREKKVAGPTGTTVVTSAYTYDALGRLATATASNGGSRSFQYDALGNVRRHNDVVNASDVTLTYRTDNRDQLCFVGYGTEQPAERRYGSQGSVVLVAGAAVTSPITIGDMSGAMPPILMVDVLIEDLTGADLVIELVSPAGTVYTLAMVNGEAPTYEETLPVPATIANEPGNGTWKLRVSNNGYPGGYLALWGMSIPLCNVVHDGDGNIVSQATPGGTRTFSYFASGQVRGVARADGSEARFRYDAFGDVQELDVQGTTTDPRRDRRYGTIERRDVTSGGTTASILTLNFPIGEMMASRRGGDDWVFSIGESRGNRFFVDAKGHFLQDVEYDAYGKPTSTGPGPDDRHGSREQWNGGDFLGAFGVSQLGARLYDPVIGRFLSPDPLVLMRTGATSNPFAFADNDPINASDPAGMCTGSETTCPGGGIAPGTVGNPNNPTTPVGGNKKAAPPPAPRPMTPAPAPDVDAAERDRQARWNERLRQQRAEEEAIRAAGEAKYQAWLAAHPDPKGGSPAAGFIFNMFVPGVFVPKYYVKTFVPLTAMQTAQTGPQYFEARDQYIAARANIALSIVNEEAATFLSMAMTLQGGMMGSVSPRTRIGRASLPARKCFVAGTPVATQDGHVPIETLELGDRVEAGNPRCAREHVPEDSLTVALDVPDPLHPGQPAHVRLVRSQPWLEENGLADGAGYVDLEELGLSGWATVTAVGPAPREQPGDGCLVLMTVNHVAHDVIALRFKGGTSIELTPMHPLYVEGRGWTPAGQLDAGQLVRADQGSLAVERVARAEPDQRVYNIEVGLEHAYRVSLDNIWAHNNCALTDHLLQLGADPIELGVDPASFYHGKGDTGLRRTLAEVDKSGTLYGVSRTKKLTAIELQELNDLRRSIVESEGAAGQPVPGYLIPPEDR